MRRIESPAWSGQFENSSNANSKFLITVRDKRAWQKNGIAVLGIQMEENQWKLSSDACAHAWNRRFTQLLLGGKRPGGGMTHGGVFGRYR